MPKRTKTVIWILSILLGLSLTANWLLLIAAVNGRDTIAKMRGTYNE